MQGSIKINLPVPVCGVHSILFHWHPSSPCLFPLVLLVLVRWQEAHNSQIIQFSDSWFNGKTIIKGFLDSFCSTPWNTHRLELSFCLGLCWGFFRQLLDLLTLLLSTPPHLTLSLLLSTFTTTITDNHWENHWHHYQRHYHLYVEGSESVEAEADTMLTLLAMWQKHHHPEMLYFLLVLLSPSKSPVIDVDYDDNDDDAQADNDHFRVLW